MFNAPHVAGEGIGPSPIRLRALSLGAGASPPPWHLWPHMSLNALALPPALESQLAFPYLSESVEQLRRPARSVQNGSGRSSLPLVRLRQ